MSPIFGGASGGGSLGDAVGTAEIEDAAVTEAKLHADVVAQLGGGSGPEEVDYVEITSSVSVASSSLATADTVITGTSQAYENVPYELEFWCPGVSSAAADDSEIRLVFFAGATHIGVVKLASADTGIVNKRAAIAKCRFTPAASTFSFVVKAFESGGDGTIWAEAGGEDTLLPAYLKVTKL